VVVAVCVGRTWVLPSLWVSAPSASADPCAAVVGRPWDGIGDVASHGAACCGEWRRAEEDNDRVAAWLGGSIQTQRSAKWE